MANRKQIAHIVGAYDHLREAEHWPEAISTTVESLMWQTQAVLGISKSELVRRIVEETLHAVDQGVAPDQIQGQITKRIQREIAANTVSDPEASPKLTGLISPYEALRRLKYHSEDYLNREFDLLLSLVPDDYLDTYYKQFTHFTPGGHWVAHGNSTRFLNSLGRYEMQFDTLAYNHESGILVANELKLAGIKNKDQILKYAHLFRALRQDRFINARDQTVLLFIGPTLIDDAQMDAEIRREVAYLDSKPKKWFSDDRSAIIDEANSISIESTTWQQLLDFNTSYAGQIPRHQQSLHKLLTGFNHSLSQKPKLRLSL